jgi:hypothetical protein
VAKEFGNTGEVILNGLESNISEVMDKCFPQPDDRFGMPDEENDELLKLTG